jgi:hypothetical protein
MKRTQGILQAVRDAHISKAIQLRKRVDAGDDSFNALEVNMSELKSRFSSFRE